MQPIYMLDARSYVLLEVMKEQFNLSNQQMLQEIQTLHQQVIDILASKNILYSKLKIALIPSQDRHEIGLVFDTQKIESSWYGDPIFRKLLPLLDKRSNHSVMAGDLIGDDQVWLFHLLSESIHLDKPLNYIHSTQFYTVYINNLSASMERTILNALTTYEPFIGHIPLTFSSTMKTYLSSVLVNLFLKHKDIIIMGHEDDVPNTENVNVIGYAFEENGYVCKSLQSTLYALFLSYKIERAIYPGFESDTEFSINSVTDSILPLSELSVHIDDEKFEYLYTKKLGTLKKAGLAKFDKDKLSYLIQKNLQSNYIYNMEFLEEYNVIKFNLLIEVNEDMLANPTKLLVAIEYKPNDRVLRVITLY